MSNEVADFDDFKSLDQLKKEVLSLTRENKAALLTIDKLLKELNKKKEEIEHLQSLVAQSVPVIKKESQKLSVAVSPEESIAQTQLERLRQTAQNRVLTLEEVRMFDLLVKNKRLVLDESTINMGKDQYRDVDEAQLVQIAAKDTPSHGDPDED